MNALRVRGVHKTADGNWTWVCGTCGTVSAAVETGRDAARQSFRRHRQGEGCSGSPGGFSGQTPDAETPMEDVKASAATRKRSPETKTKTKTKKAKHVRKPAQIATTRRLPREAVTGVKPIHTWRLATIVNARTGRQNIIRVRADGGLLPTDVRRFGMGYVESWVEVQSPGRAEAVRMLVAGEGVARTRKASTSK